MAFRFKDNTNQFQVFTLQALDRFLLRQALMIERHAKLSMGGGGKPHQPSRPGEPPHVDTGRLRASITHEGPQPSDTGNEREVRVGTNVNYGRFLEQGTRFIEPRPWLRPAFLSVVQA